MASPTPPAVQAMIAIFEELLQSARERKPSSGIEPTLLLPDFEHYLQEISFQRVKSADAGTDNSRQQAQYAIIETAVRQIFHKSLAVASIQDPEFVQIWNLLDIVSFFADEELCEPSLTFWLIEELLDSQTINGCRLVFDYLESRRERIIVKHFHKKNLVILRSCNELLRRLSRAENTVFCGRVFIFLFQSFPLGDKSAVNLRGEFHVENTTAFEDILETVKPEDEVEKMDVDKLGVGEDGILSGTTSPAPVTDDAGPTRNPKLAGDNTEAVAIATGIDGLRDDKLELDALYPIFWSLQQSFSSPTRLFDTQNFNTFKNGLSRTFEVFGKIQKQQISRTLAKEKEAMRRRSKRKRGDIDGELASAFNPKYLTSRDLFELEMSDLAFRRHILVQTLILLDFFLSLRAKSKAKMSGLASQNKSVMFNYTLSEEDANWANETRTWIATYLQGTLDGKFYFRMVDTVLCRDKNWVRWKAETCTPIRRAPISATELADARGTAARVCAPKKLRATPLGSLDLSFLSEVETQAEVEKLTAKERFTVPEPGSFEMSIAEDEFDLSRSHDEEEKQLALVAKASKSWRALRIVSRSRLNIFDKIDNNAQDLSALFKSSSEQIKKDVVTEPDGTEKPGTNLDEGVEAMSMVVETSPRPREGDEGISPTEPSEMVDSISMMLDSVDA